MPRISQEEFTNKAQEGEFHLFTVDTNVFIQNKFKLHGKKLSDIIDSYYDSSFIIPKIVYDETMKHYKEFMTNNMRDAKQILKRLDFFKCAEECIDFFENLDVEKYCERTFDEYLLNPEDVIIDNDVDINMIADSYFNSNPPFSCSTAQSKNIKDTGEEKAASTKKTHKQKDKKNEFPDAIALQSLERFAISRVKNIAIVSNDNDWKEYCKNSEHLYTIDENIDVLPTALFALKGTRDATDSNIIKKYIAEQLFTEHTDVIESAIKNFLDDTSNIECDATSRHSFELENDSNEINEIKYNDTLVSIQDKFDSEVVASVLIPIKFTCHASANLAYYDSVDREYIDMGSQYISADVDSEIELELILHKDDLEGISKDSLVSADVISGNISVDLGDLEINYGEE